jgi:hypothetical protein
MPVNVNNEILGRKEIIQKILTFQNKIHSRRNPRFANENIKNRKQKKGIITTIHENNNITGFITS